MSLANPSEELSAALADHRRRGELQSAPATLDEYQASLSDAARTAGQEAAEAGDREWADRALSWIGNLPIGSSFVADDLRSAVGASSAAGAVFTRARRRGWILPTEDFAASRARSRHGNPNRVWRRV